MDAYGTRYRCGFPGCTKRYASTDGVRKHARKIHKEWLRDVDEASSSRDSKVYGSKPSTYCIAEQGLMTGLDDDSLHGGHSYLNHQAAQQQQQSDENACPPLRSPPLAPGAAQPFHPLEHLPAARAVAACLVHQASGTSLLQRGDSPYGASDFGRLQRPGKRSLEFDGADGQRRAYAKTEHEWGSDWERAGLTNEQKLEELCDDARPLPPPLSVSLSANDLTLTPQTAMLKPSASFDRVTPFSLSPSALPVSALPKTASVISLEKFLDRGELDESEYMAFVSSIFAQ